MSARTRSGEPVAEHVAMMVVGLVRIAWWSLRHIRATLVIALIFWVLLFEGWTQAVSLAILAAGVLLAWRLVHARSFRRFAGWRLRSVWRRIWRYGPLRWRPAMACCGLSVTYRQVEAFPKLRRVVSRSAYADQLLVRMLHGQAPEDYERQATELAHSFAARVCRVRQQAPSWLWLDFLHADALISPIAALQVPEEPDLAAIPVGRREDGETWALRLLGTHVLVAGVTGAGKGSVVWSLIRGVCPLIKDGSVEVWALDPKGGMELAPGRALFSRFEADDFERMADLLDEAVALMRQRARRLAGLTRQHVPTPEDPLVLVVVDEVANLTAYLPDRKLRERLAQSLSVLLTQGRAVGVNVIAALQDPRKEVLAFRNLFPTKVALRLDEPSQVDMVLGDGARERGARCDQIPESLPGVGFVRVDGVREPARVRASYVTDDDIAEMAARYPALAARPVALAA